MNMLILVRGSPNINLPNIDPIVRRINSFKSLPHGWHYGEGRGADQLAVESALHAYRAFRQFGITRIEAFPSVAGEVLIAGYFEEETVEFLCGIDGGVNVLHEQEDEIVYDENYPSVENATEFLRTLPWNLIGKSSVYSILTTTVGRKEDTPAWLSMPLQQMTAFYQLIENAPKNTVVVNVNTSGGITIRESLENHRYFGDFGYETFQTKLISPTRHQAPEILAISMSETSQRNSGETS